MPRLLASVAGSERVAASSPTHPPWQPRRPARIKKRGSRGGSQLGRKSWVVAAIGMLRHLLNAPLTMLVTRAAARSRSPATYNQPGTPLPHLMAVSLRVGLQGGWYKDRAGWAVRQEAKAGAKGGCCPPQARVLEACSWATHGAAVQVRNAASSVHCRIALPLEHGSTSHHDAWAGRGGGRAQRSTWQLTCFHFYRKPAPTTQLPLSSPAPFSWKEGTGGMGRRLSVQRAQAAAQLGWHAAALLHASRGWAGQQPAHASHQSPAHLGSLAALRASQGARQRRGGYVCMLKASRGTIAKASPWPEVE